MLRLGVRSVSSLNNNLCIDMLLILFFKTDFGLPSYLEFVSTR